jgi:N-formylglutamate amidohydrolase
MTAVPDFSPDQAFEVRGAPGQKFPFVLNSPHSGRHYPERFLAMSRLDRNAIRRSEDSFVDELFAGAMALGAPMLAAHFPRAYLDVNREPWELDPRMFVEPVPPFCNIRSPRVAGGLGTVPRIVGEGQDIYFHRLPLREAMSRIDGIYKPYHGQLKRLLAITHARFGYAVLIDCHSMPAGIRVGEAGVKPDFIIGDRFGASAAAALTDCTIETLNAMGYRVVHNKPYAGGFITEHYGSPATGFHAIQIEINRGLYMSERTFEKSDGFLALAKNLTALVARLMEMPPELLLPLPLAAE